MVIFFRIINIKYLINFENKLVSAPCPEVDTSGAKVVGDIVVVGAENVVAAVSFVAIVEPKVVEAVADLHP